MENASGAIQERFPEGERLLGIGAATKVEAAYIASEGGFMSQMPLEIPVLLRALLVAASGIYAQVPPGYGGKPFGDSALSLPGRVLVQRYDQGAKNVTWFDATPGNEGAYAGRNPTDVDLAVINAMDHLAAGTTTMISPNEVYLRSVDVGDWLKFTVNVRSAGTYAISAKAGMQAVGAASLLRLDVLKGNDSLPLGDMALPLSPCRVKADVECYHYWDSFPGIALVDLKAGLQVLRVQVASIGFNLAYLEFQRADPAEALFRVNCGGNAFTDPRGGRWEADGHFTGGGTLILPGSIKGSDLTDVYRSERWFDPAKPALKYSFPVASDNLRVRLHFAEIWPAYTGRGHRSFDVTINGTTVLKDFDIGARVGVDSALVREFPVPRPGGAVEIGFLNKVEHAKISGIEIFGPLMPVGLAPADRHPKGTGSPARRAGPDREAMARRAVKAKRPGWTGIFLGRNRNVTQ